MRRTARIAGLAAGVFLLLTGCVSTKDIEALQGQISEVQRQLLQIQKQSSSKEEVADLEGAIKRQTDALLKSEADVQVNLDSLSSQIDQLEANLEDTNYRLAQLSQQIAVTNQELKSFRSTALSMRGPAVGSGDGAAATPGRQASGSADPQDMYQKAYNDYLRGNYDLAVLGFRQYLDVFPETELADNAVYWIGESYFGQGQYRQAIDEFEDILTNYPRSDKSASATLKKGYAYLELREQAQGVAQLQRVVREYPGSDEANLARQRLRQLGIDGR